MNELTLIQKFSDPAYFDSLTMGEKMHGSFITTVLGMGITFLVLFLLWGVIVVLGKTIVYADQKTTKKNGTNNTQVTSFPASTEQDLSAQDEELENEELIAVIMAAIYAASENSEKQFVIKKIQRINAPLGPWVQDGR